MWGLLVNLVTYMLICEHCFTDIDWLVCILCDIQDNAKHIALDAFSVLYGILINMKICNVELLMCNTHL